MAQSNYEIRIRITPEGFEVIDGAASDLRRMEGAAGAVNNKFSQMNRTLGRVASGVERLGKRMMLLGTGIIGGIGALTYAGVKYNATVEQLQAKLKIFLGTQKKVNEAYEWASKVTLRVPMTRRDIIPIVTMLEQYGFAYDEWTESVIDAAAATKRPGESIQAQMETVAMALGRIKSGQIGEGLLMLRRAGLAIENAGIKFSKAGQVIDEPRVVLDKLKKYLDTEFKGAAEEFGKTWEGQMMKIKSLTMRALGAGVAPMFDKLKSRIVMFTDYIASPEGQGKMKEWAAILGRMLEAALKLGDQLVTKVLPKVMQFADWFSKLGAKSQWLLTLFPLVGGAVLVLAAKVIRLAAALRMAGLGGGAAVKGISAAGTAAKGAAAGFNIWALAIAAALAQIGGLAKFAEWIIPKLSGGKAGGPIKGAKMAGSLAKDVWRGAGWDEVSQKYRNVKTYDEWQGRFVQTPGEGQTPMRKPMGPHSAGATSWKGMMAGWTDTAPGGGGLGGLGGDLGGGGGGGGGSGVGTRARGGTTYYQTIENVHIKAEKIDEKSLLAATRNIVETEMPA